MPSILDLKFDFSMITCTFTELLGECVYWVPGVDMRRRRRESPSSSFRSKPCSLVYICQPQVGILFLPLVYTPFPNCEKIVFLKEGKMVTLIQIKMSMCQCNNQ